MVDSSPTRQAFREQDPIGSASGANGVADPAAGPGDPSSPRWMGANISIRGNTLSTVAASVDVPSRGSLIPAEPHRALDLIMSRILRVHAP
jgi:hypothetical protein